MVHASNYVEDWWALGPCDDRLNAVHKEKYDDSGWTLDDDVKQAVNLTPNQCVPC